MFKVDLCIVCCETLLNIVVTIVLRHFFKINFWTALSTNLILFRINATFVGLWNKCIPQSALSKKFTGKRILITGSSSGIGRCIAQELKKCTNNKCYITGMNRSDKTDEDAVDEMLRVDFGEKKSADEVYETVLKGAYDYVFLCSGYADVFNRDYGHAQRVMDVNLANQIIPACHANMEREQKAQLLIISSVNSDIATPMGESYAASKAASTKYALGFDNASVIFPGGVKTNFHSRETMVSPKTGKLIQNKEKAPTQPDFVARTALRSVGMFKTCYVGVDAHIFKLVRLILPEWILIRLVYRV